MHILHISIHTYVYIEFGVFFAYVVDTFYRMYCTHIVNRNIHIAEVVWPPSSEVCAEPQQLELSPLGSD